jgi:PAS domain S-box-containing protein
MLGAAVLTTRDDRIVSVSDSALRLIGARSEEQVLGRSPLDFIHAESQQQVRDLMRAVVQEGATPPPLEGRIVRADGTPIDVKLTAMPVPADEGAAVQFILNDLTEQREREASRAALSRDLEEKNSDLEASVYAASHDLRSPLLNVMGFSRQLDTACRQIAPLVHANGEKKEELEGILENTVPRALRFIEQGVTRMDSLLTGFLRYSRIGRQEIEPQKLDMNAMLKSISSNLAYQMQQSDTGLRIEDLPPCTGDPMQINQLFSNLLDNAIKYRKPGVPCVILVTGKTDGAQVIYSVTDNGTGIAPEHQRVIFEIFHRLNPSIEGGEGLGLTIAQRIAQRHNGAVGVVSQPGVGSTFTVRLPAAS